MILTEKETLLKMIYCLKKHNCLCSYSYLKCSICFYGRKNRCDYSSRNKNENPEQYYIEKFGYESLIEELL
jgi:hypothetical protein